MKDKLILFGDQHTFQDAPFYQAKIEYFDWIIEHPMNNESNTFLFVGDFFHNNQPTPTEYDLAHNLISHIKAKIIILSGNGIHEFNRRKKAWAIDPLKVHSHVSLIKFPKDKTIGNLKLLLMPWIPSRYLNDLTMKEYYEQGIPLFKDYEYDYVIGHFNHKEFFGHKVDISYIKTKHIRMGHIHIPDKEGEYVGVDTITRHDERGIDCNLNVIDLKTKEEVLLPIPKFLDYYKISYGDVVNVEAPNFLLDIVDAPNKEKAYQKYGQYVIRDIQLKKDGEITSDSGEKSGKFDQNVFLTRYIEDKKITDGVAEKLRSVING